MAGTEFIMKSSNQKTSNHVKAVRYTVALAAFLLLAAGSYAGIAANPAVFPINSTPYGKSYGEWGVAHWQWALGIPAANNPLLDTTGEFAGVNQSGPVWFLEGSLGGSAERNITIPPGKAILMPVHTWIFGSCAGDCDPTNPGVPCDIPTLQAAAAAAADGATVLEVSIDGRAVSQVSSYRAQSPGGFSITLPEANVLQFLGLPTPAGIYSPQVADGFWLMLKPLSPGTHTIQMHVVNPAAGIEYTQVYHITIGS
jgi:hypothetical protein